MGPVLCVAVAFCFRLYDVPPHSPCCGVWGLGLFPHLSPWTDCRLFEGLLLPAGLPQLVWTFSEFKFRPNPSLATQNPAAPVQRKASRFHLYMSTFRACLLQCFGTWFSHSTSERDILLATRHHRIQKSCLWWLQDSSAVLLTVSLPDILVKLKILFQSCLGTIGKT